MTRSVLLALMLATLAACGQKGPLYLRDNPPPGVKPTKPEPTRPTPYPTERDSPSESR